MKLEHFEKLGFAYQEIQKMTQECFTGVEVPPDDILKKEFDAGDVYVHLYNSTKMPENIRVTNLYAFAIVTKKFSQPFIWLIATDPVWRGEGHASLLIDEIETDARQNKAKSISLTVHVDNVAAQRLYLKKGFRVEQILEGYYGNRPGLFMRKMLR